VLNRCEAGDFLWLVDELRKRGASEVSAHGYSAKFFAPHVEPEVAEDPAKANDLRRVSLNESERDELDRLRAAKVMYSELGLADED
jgi:hypothetical protein